MRPVFFALNELKAASSIAETPTNDAAPRLICGGISGLLANAHLIGHKRVIIFDTFRGKDYNVNSGDRVADLPHGRVCQILAQAVLRRPVEPFDVTQFGEGAYMQVHALEALIDQLERDYPVDGPDRFGNVVISMSIGTDTPDHPALPRMQQLLDYLLDRGAIVNVAAGNHKVNQVSLLDHRLKVVGASDGVVGEPAKRSPSPKLVVNPETDRVVNGVLRFTPVFSDGPQHTLLGFDVNGDRIVEVLASEITDTSESVAAIQGRAVEGARIAFASLAAEGFSGTLAGRVVRFQDLIDAHILTPEGARNIPPGTSPEKLYVAAPELLLAIATAGKAGGPIFFVVDGDGKLRYVGDDAPFTLDAPATSWTTPQQSAIDAGADAR